VLAEAAGSTGVEELESRVLAQVQADAAAAVERARCVVVGGPRDAAVA
jgi:hypothetical protein